MTFSAFLSTSTNNKVERLFHPEVLKQVELSIKNTAHRHNTAERYSTYRLDYLPLLFRIGYDT